MPTQSENETPFFLPLLKKEKLTSDCYSFFFKRNGDERDFTPGQYFEIKLKIKNPDDRGDTRVFTVASSPTEREYFMITTRIIKSSFKIALNNLQIGETAEFNGPWNDLNFDEGEIMPSVFLAGGIGVTPFHSIVKYVTNKNLKNQMILFASWKKREEIVFHKFFVDANNHLENFVYVPILTEENLDKSNWNGETGRISQEMIRKYVYDFLNSKYFIAGPPPMVKALKQMVIDMNISKENIISEDFEGYINDKF